MLRRFRTGPVSARAVAALGATQIIGYGTLYYAFPIAVPALALSYGVSEAWLYGVFSVGMLGGGLIAPHVGRAMDRYQAPRVMAVGSALVAGLLALLPLAPDRATLTALILGLELVSVAVLYDGAFATLALLRGTGARRAITHLTLIAGFASTVFWPLSGWMIGTIGWQATYAAFAALHLVVALPLHVWLARQARLGNVQANSAGSPAGRPAAALPPEMAARAFRLVAVGFALSGMVIAALTVHLVPLLQATGLGDAAYLAAMVMGPAQVLIRATDALFWKGLHPVDVALISAGALPASVVALTVFGGGAGSAIAFAAILGIGGGLSSIVRGTVPLALFGANGFGLLLGRLTLIRTLLSAIAPFLFALLLAQAGPRGAMVVAAAVGTAGLIPLLLLRSMLRRAYSIPGTT
jgi:MFS family permease